MKIAITSQGKEQNSQPDMSFRQKGPFLQKMPYFENKIGKGTV